MFRILPFLLIITFPAAFLLTTHASDLNAEPALEDVMATSGFNGVVCIKHKAQAAKCVYKGFADASNNVPLNETHRFSPGSVGKEFTTISILQ